MTVKREVGIGQIQAILREWQDSGRNLHASVFDAGGMRSCAGQVASLDKDVAVISDSRVELCVPYSSAGDCAIIMLDQKTKSLTLTWGDGMSAFIVTRDRGEDRVCSSAQMATSLETQTRR